MESARPLLAAPLLGALALASAGWAQGPDLSPPRATPQKAAGPVGLPHILEPTPPVVGVEEELPAEAAPTIQATEPAEPAEPPAPTPDLPAPLVAQAAAPASAIVDPPAVQSHTASVPQDPRRLAPRSQSTTPRAPGERPQLLSFSWDSLPLDPVTSAAALGLVVGLFLLTAALLKRATPKSQRLLPGEVASVVGRIPLGGKQTAHLLKVGSKLVLVHITPDGAKPLTEVTDPAEVSRLLGLCEQGGEHSATTAFQDVFEKLTTEPAEPGFLGGESPLIDRQQLAAAYAKTPGGRGAR